MNFVKRIKEENKEKLLSQAFKDVYNEEKWNIEVEIFSETGKLALYTNLGNVAVVYAINNFDLIQLGDGISAYKNYGVTHTRSKKIYLKFMKQNFPEYEEEYIKELRVQTTKAIAEFISI